MSHQPYQDSNSVEDLLRAQLQALLLKPDRKLVAELTLQLERFVGETDGSVPLHLFESAVSQSPLAISITDHKANILYCNDSFSQVTGYGQDEVLGQNESILSYKSTPQRVYQEMWRALTAKESWRGKLVNRRKSGERYLAEVLIAPVLNSNGEISHYLGIHQDMTELHTLQQRVANQKELIESVVDSAPDAIVVLDSDYKVVLDNHAYKKLYADMRVGEPARVLLDALEKDVADFSQLMADKVSFADKVVECRTGKEGERRWFSCSGNWFNEHSTDADDFFVQEELSYLMLMVHEVTTLKRQQEEIKHNAMRELMAEETLNTSVRETLSAAAYKLQEPLNMLNAAIAMMGRRQSEDVEDPVLSLLYQISEKGEEGLSLLHKISPKNVEHEVEPININQCVHEVLQVLTPCLLSEGIVVSWQPDSVLPSVMGSAQQLRGLFRSVLDNAIEAIVEASPERREIEIVTKRDEDWIELSISDSGNGIDKDIHYKVFEPFFTTKQDLNRAHTGMGLAMAQEAINAHAGTMAFDSSYSNGCRIILRIPMTRP